MPWTRQIWQVQMNKTASKLKRSWAKSVKHLNTCTLMPGRSEWFFFFWGGGVFSPLPEFIKSTDFINFALFSSSPKWNSGEFTFLWLHFKKSIILSFFFHSFQNYRVTLFDTNLTFESTPWKKDLFSHFYFLLYEHYYILEIIPPCLPDGTEWLKGKRMTNTLCSQKDFYISKTYTKLYIYTYIPRKE